MENTKEEVVKQLKEKYLYKRNYILTNDEIRLLLEFFQNGDEDAGEVIVNSMDRLIYYLIRKYGKHLVDKGCTFDDFFNDCKSATAAVYKQFSLAQNTAKFTSYFSQAVFHYLCNLSKEKQKRGTCLSLDMPVGEDGDESFGDFISDEVDYEEIAIQNCQLSQIKDYSKTLPLLSQKFIKKYYFEHKNLKQISEEDSRTYSVVTGLRARSLQYLKDAASGNAKYEFCGMVGKNMTVTKCANNYKQKFLLYKNKIDFERELIPRLTEEEFLVFDYYLNSAEALTLREVKEITHASKEVRKILNAIFTKIRLILRAKNSASETCENAG